MRKLASFLIVMMIFGAVPGMCLVEPVDQFIENRKQSDMTPIQDAGQILDVTNQGVDKVYGAVTEPMAPVLNPVRDLRDAIIKHSKIVVNKTWDTLTFRSFRTSQ